jgi:hypothetical protein
MIRYIRDILPKELLQEIQTLVSLLPYNPSKRTVMMQEIEGFSEWVDSIDYIQEITSSVCILYNNYLATSPRFEVSPFPFREAEQIYNSIKYYLPDEFVGYTLRRFHVNRTPKTPGYPISKCTTPHYDSPENSKNEYKTILFYVNSSDGNTILFNEFGDYNIMRKNNNINLSNMNLTVAREQTPLENSAIILSSNRIHALRPPTINEYRFVFNIVLEKPIL